MGRIRAGRILLLIDPNNREDAFGPDMAHITEQQLQQADLAALTKADRASPDALAAAEKQVRGSRPRGQLFRVSFRTGAGVEELISTLLEESSEEVARQRG